MTIVAGSERGRNGEGGGAGGQGDTGEACPWGVRGEWGEPRCRGAGSVKRWVGVVQGEVEAGEPRGIRIRCLRSERGKRFFWQQLRSLNDRAFK